MSPFPTSYMSWFLFFLLRISQLKTFIPILFSLYDDKGNNYEDDLKLYHFSAEKIEQIYTKEGKSIKTYKPIEF